MTFLPSRKIALVFVAVFIIGAVVGALLCLAFQDMTVPRLLTRTADPVSNAARINDKYVREYHLTADEQARIAPLTRKMAQSLYLTRRQFGVDIIGTLDDYHRQIGAQMRPDHRAAFEKANEERRKRLSSVLLLDQPVPVSEQK